MRTRNTGLKHLIATRFAIALGVVAAFAAVAGTSLADPVFGEQFEARQPDGSKVPVRVWGDEFYRVVESLDGYTLIPDPTTQVICYARLSGDGMELESTGAPVKAKHDGALGLTPHLRVKPESVRAKAAAAKVAESSYFKDALAGRPAPDTKAGPLTTGSVLGLTILVDFPDVPATISAASIDNYCNQLGYTGYGNNGSIRDYFRNVSGDVLDYTNYVTPLYYRALHPKTYYDDTAQPYASRARELILEALNYLETTATLNFSAYDKNGDHYIDAINCLYAGNRDTPWSTGLWPHRSSVYGFAADGVNSAGYQITNIGSSLSIGTFCHENGHLLMNWRDLYDYDQGVGVSRGMGAWDLMSSSGSTNPVQPNAHYKDLAGWAAVTDLGPLQTGLSAAAGFNSFYRFRNPGNANEFYMIENRQKTGRDANLPGSGLAILHVDTAGSNNYEDMTPARHYYVTLVQADGRWDLEHNANGGDASDLYRAPAYQECSSRTSPNTNWWSGGQSFFTVRNIGASGSVMTFDAGLATTSKAGGWERY